MATILGRSLERRRSTRAAGCRHAGGTSVGREDYVPKVVGELGELLVHGVAMRPASPTGIGRIGAAKVFLLPGNPVSCLAAYDLLVSPALRRWSRAASAS